jgi:hypothetical protein
MKNWQKFGGAALGLMIFALRARGGERTNEGRRADVYTVAGRRADLT